MIERPQGLSKRDILHIFFKNLGMISSIVLLTMLLTIVILFFMSKKYDVESSILFKAPRNELSSLYDLDDINQRPYVNIAISEMIYAEVAILESPVLLRQVISEDIGVETVLRMGNEPTDRTWLTPIRNSGSAVVNSALNVGHRLLVAVGFARSLSPLDQAYDKISRNLDITKVRNSNAISVTLRCENPQIGADIVNALIARYKVRHAELYELTQDVEFFEQRLAQIRHELDGVEYRLNEMRNEYNVSNPKSVYDAKMYASGNLSQSLAAARARLAALEARKANFEALSDADAGVFAKSEVMLANPNLNEIMKSVLATQENYNRAASRFVPGSHPYESAKREYQAMQVRFKSEVQSTIKGDELAILEAREEIRKYEDAIAGLASEMKVVESKETEYERLLLEREIIQSAYREYADRLERARTASILNIAQISNVAQISEAVPPVNVATPKAGLVLLVAFVLSLLASFGLVLLFEYLNQTYRMDDDVERHLGLRVVTSLPEL